MIRGLEVLELGLETGPLLMEFLFNVFKQNLLITGIPVLNTLKNKIFTSF
jgi:hypothetical protein